MITQIEILTKENENITLFCLIEKKETVYGILNLVKIKIITEVSSVMGVRYEETFRMDEEVQKTLPINNPRLHRPLKY